MIVASIRSGLVEAVHPVAAAAVDSGGRLVASIGEDVGRPFFLRLPAVRPQAVSGVRLAEQRRRARAFARLATLPELAGVADSLRRFGALASDGHREDAAVTRWLPVAAKGGAQGCIGIAWIEGGIGVAAKAWSGHHGAAAVGAIEVLTRLGVVPDHPLAGLEPVARPVVLGGSRPVGRLQPLEDAT